MTTRYMKGLPVRRANHFGNIEIRATIEDLTKRGICFGDSVSVQLSNGYTFSDIPYYNSFLGPGDKPCLYGIASAYDYVGIGYPVVGNPWEECGAPTGGWATIRLEEAGKYASELECYGINIQTHPSPGMLPSQFANFRALATPEGSTGRFFRCASPIRTDTHCSSQALTCVEELQPGLILNLSDTPSQVDAFCLEHPESRYAALRQIDAVLALRQEVDFTSSSCAAKLASALAVLPTKPGPYLIHCRYGVDRTGFLCVLLEALAGVSRSRIAADYMLSYEHVYGVECESQRYQAIRARRFGEIEGFFCKLGGNDDTLDQHALEAGARNYLLSGGMTQTSLECLIKLLV